MTFFKWSHSLSQIFIPSVSLSKPHQPDSERGDADGKSEVSTGADNLGFEGQQPTSANERVNQNAKNLSGSIVCLAKLLNQTFVIALFEFYNYSFYLANTYLFCLLMDSRLPPPRVRVQKAVNRVKHL